jgi:cell division protein FtsB
MNLPMSYQKNRLSHKKELYYILCIVAVMVILLFSFWGPGGYRDMARARLELQAHRERVNELNRSNYEKKRSIEALRSDRDTLERQARENGYGRDGDIIQQLPEPPKSK